jgi:hypothetical protein
MIRETTTYQGRIKLENKSNDINKYLCELQYTLTYEEAYEAFLWMADKFGKKVRVILSMIVALACGVMLYLQYREPMAIQYTVLTIIGIVILFQLLYLPIIKAKKGAAVVKNKGGEYRYSITGDGYIHLFKGEDIPLVGDKDARAYETDTLFVLRPDRIHTFCIPKRVLSESDENDLREIFKTAFKKLENRA